MVNIATRRVIVNLPMKLGITIKVKTGSKTDVAMAAARAEKMDCLFSLTSVTGAFTGVSSGAGGRDETSDADSSDEGDSEP